MIFEFDQTKIIFDGYKPLNQASVFIKNNTNSLNIVINGDCNSLVAFRKISSVKAQIDLKVIKESEIIFNRKFQSGSETF
jgi:hypothetical protein